MATNLGNIDVENNDLFASAVNLGTLKGTNTGAGVLEALSNDNSSDVIDYYRFQLDTTAPLNSYIELSSPDVPNVQALYQIHLYKYDASNNSYQKITQNYQLFNYPYTYRIDLNSLTAGTYVFGVTGAEREYDEVTGFKDATDLYNLRISIPSLTLPGTVINGTTNSESLTGGSEENTINGLAGNDTLNGGDGNDVLIGSYNNDLLNGGNGIDRVVDSLSNTAATFRGGEFLLTNDRLVGDSVDYLVSVEEVQLTGNDGDNELDASSFTLGAVILDGGDGNDTLFGGSGNDLLTGGWGSNYIDGGVGQDTMIGELFPDTYVVDNVGDVIVETGMATDLVYSSITYTLGSNLEYITLFGTAAINGTGNELNNEIEGNDNNNILTGLAGNDTLIGSKGLNTLIGGDGNDTYYVSMSTDVIIETSTTDVDKVYQKNWV